MGALLALAACGGDAGTRVRRLSIATGGTGGVYYVYGGALARLISESIPGVEATAEATSASVDNLKFLRDGKADIAFTLSDTLADAVKGRGAFDGRPIALRTLASLYPNASHLVVRAGSGAKSVAGLRDRVVSTGAAGSGTDVIGAKVLRAAGLDPERDIRRENLSAQASADALRDSKIDAFFWSGGVPTAAVMDLASTLPGGIALVPLDRLLPKLREEPDGASLYRPLTIPREAYAGLPADVPTFGVMNALVVREDFPEGLAHDIVRMMFDRRGVLEGAHAEAKKLDRATAAADPVAPLHPGAARYFAATAR